MLLEEILNYSRTRQKEMGLFPLKFSPLKRLLIDLCMIIFNELIHSKNTHKLLRSIKDFVFSFGELRDSFVTLISDIQWEKKAMEMGHVFIKADFLNTRKERKKTAVVIPKQSRRY